MIRQFFKESLIYAGSSALARGISFVLVPFYTRVFSPADFGMIDILAVVGGLVNVVIVVEITQGVARFFTAAQSQRDRVGYAATALWFTLAVYSAFFVAAAIFSAQLSAWILESEQQQPVFLVAIASMWAGGIYYLLQSQLRWQLQPRRYAIVSIFSTLVTTAGSVVLVFGLEFGVSGVFWGSFAGSIAGGTLAYYYCHVNLGSVFDPVKLRRMLAFTLPLAISSVAAVATTYADRVIIKELMGLDDLGLYGIAQRFASLMGLVLIGFQGSLTPLVTKYQLEPDTPLQLARIFRYFLALALPLNLALCIYARELVILLTAPPYHAAYTLIPLLATSSLLAGMYVFAPGLWLAKKTGFTMKINLFTALLNIALVVCLVPAMGLAGAAMGTLLSAIVAFSLYMFFNQKYYPIPVKWGRIALSVITFVITGYLASLLQLSLLTGITVKFILLMTGTLLIWLTLLQIDEVKQLARTARSLRSRS